MVSARQRVGAVTGVPERRQGQFWYPVFFGPGRTDVLPEEDLEVYVGTADVRSMMRNGVFAGREALSRLVTQLKLSLDLRSQIYALFASKTHFYPYQFKPLLKFFESRNHRLLIADEVGLGKTIEAGLILTELRHRRPDLSRVLIVPPAHLRHKWQEEMRRRFNRHFRVLSSGDVHDFLREYEREGTDTELWGIVSLQTLRGARVMERWEEVGPEFDMVVFDEAGRLRNPDTRSHRVASLVSESADALLLLTATPVQTGAKDLFHLLRLLDPEAFNLFDVFDEQLNANGHVLAAQSLLRDGNASAREALERLRRVESTPFAARFLANPVYQELMERIPNLGDPNRRTRVELQRDVEALSIFGHVLSRTRKRDVQENQPERRARTWSCKNVSLAETDFYAEVTRICRDAYESADDRRGASFGVIQPQRQMASCMAVMVDYIEARRDRMEEEELELIDVDPDDGDDDTTEGSTRPKPRWEELGDLEEWRTRLREHDGKLQGLLEVLTLLEEEEPGAKVLIFSFFKRTVAYLQSCLEANGIRTLTLTGDTPTNPGNPDRDERHQTIERFRSDSSIRVLVATEVADEGLDLQFAHCMVNYDLPWNPMRIEQRIGRIDRIGQESAALQIINLSMPDTIEDRILELLYERIGIFRESVGDLESIVGEVIEDLQKELFSKSLTPEEEATRITKAAEVIQRRAHMSEKLQDESEALIGHDEFFLDEIERARNRKRYLSGEELLLYLRDYLADHHRGASLVSDEGRPDVWNLRLTSGLRETVRASLPSGDRELLAFLSRCSTGVLSLTTTPEVAEDSPEVDLLTFYHPLVRAVSQHYEENVTELHPVTHVRVEFDEVVAGTYAWLLYSIEIDGARPTRDLELIAVDVDAGEVLGEDECESLLWRMVAEAQSIPEAQRHSGVSDGTYSIAVDGLVARLNEKFESRKRANEALVSNRLASLRETYERNHELREQRLADATARGRNASYIKGLETRIRTLEAGYQSKTAEIESTRKMSKSYQSRGGGVVEVRRAE